MPTPTSPADEAPASPLDAVFEKAVRPFADSSALRASLPPHTPIVRMKKNEHLPVETRELEGGLTLTVPVLGALKDSAVAGWQEARDFDLESLENDAVALLVEEGADGQVHLRVVTRAERGAFLVADLSGMLEALKALVDNPAFRAFPGGEFLIEALQGGLAAAQEDLTKTLREKGPGGAPSLIEEFRQAAKARTPEPSKAKARRAKARRAKAPKPTGAKKKA